MYDKLREREREREETEKEKRQRQRQRETERQREIVRSSHWRCSVKKVLLKNFAKSTGKSPVLSIFFNKVAGLRSATLLKKKLWHRCFPVNFAKFLRTPFVQNTSTSGRLSYKERRCQTKFLEGCC